MIDAANDFDDLWLGDLAPLRAPFSAPSRSIEKAKFLRHPKPTFQEAGGIDEQTFIR